MKSGSAYLLAIGIAVGVVLLWFAGWAFDAAVDGAKRRLSGAVASPAAPPARAPARIRFAEPHPVDHPLPVRAHAIGIFATPGEQLVDRCTGPAADGRCPRRLPDGTVPCAGRLLSLPAPVRSSSSWHVPPGYTSCPVGSYDAYR